MNQTDKEYLLLKLANINIDHIEQSLNDLILIIDQLIRAIKINE